jgi:hypothetical protein
VKRLLVSFLAFALMPSVLSGEWPPGPGSIPEPGTIEWAEALVAAGGSLLQEAPDSTTLVKRYERLLALDQGCTSCRKRIYEGLENLLKAKYYDPQALHRIQEAEFRDDPISLGRLYVETGRLDEAEKVVSDAMKQGGRVERQLDLLEVLGEARSRRGDVRGAQKIARRLLSEVPVSRRYCDRALKWMATLGEEPVSFEDSFHYSDFPARFERIRNLERARGNDPYVSCFYSHELLFYDRWVNQRSPYGPPVPEETASLYPKGVDQALLDLAHRTPDSKVRAAILLTASFRKSMKDRAAAFALAQEAKAAGTARSIQVGVALQELEVFPVGPDEERKKYEALVVRLIDSFPEYEAACDGCVAYWSALNYPWPEFSNRMGDWQRRCGETMRSCRNPVDRWRNIAYSFGTAVPHAKEVYETLLTFDLPEPAVPLVRLRLSEAIRSSEPKRAWQLEREAIHHPEYPGLSNSELLGGSALRAEQNGDFETALFVSLLLPRSFGGCGNRGEVPDPHPFLLAYYRLRLGLEPEENWGLLLSQLPVSPEGSAARFYHKAEYLDRLLGAARATWHEKEALEWLERLSKRYQGASASSAAAVPGTPAADLHETESLLNDYIEQLKQDLDSQPGGAS